MDKRILGEPVDMGAYEVRFEEWRMEEEDSWTEMKQAYTKDGHYIGSCDDAIHLCDSMGILPELRTPDSNTCSIGFCECEQKWYGWSHRAIFGFGLGDMVAEGDCCASSGWTQEWLDEHPKEDASLPVGFVAKTLADAKRMAEAFAESVS